MKKKLINAQKAIVQLEQMRKRLENAKRKLTREQKKAKLTEAYKLETHSNSGLFSSEDKKLANDIHTNQSNVEKNIEKDIDRLERDINRDYGPNYEFFALSGKCFSKSQSGFDYSLCFFDEAIQSEDKGARTSLGKFTEYKNDYSELIFKNGKRCAIGTKSRTASVSIE